MTKLNITEPFDKKELKILRSLSFGLRNKIMQKRAMLRETLERRERETR